MRSLLIAVLAYSGVCCFAVAPAVAVADPANEFLAVQVAPDGRFNMGANPEAADCGSGPIFTTPCRYNLSFFWPETPDTSFTTIRIDGLDHAYGSGVLVVPPTDSPDGLTNTSAEESGGVRVTQELAIVQGETGKADTARIRYVTTNIDTRPHDVGLRIMIDTMLNDNDGAPFRVAGTPITTETDFLGAAVPSFFDVFFDLAVPEISARGTLRRSGFIPPDRFVIANWGRIFRTLFDFTVNPGVSVTDDSAIAIYWNPVTLAPGESRVLSAFYGVSAAAGGGGLLVTAPSLLSVAPGPTPGSLVWAPNPFTVGAFFTNGASSASGALVDIDLVLDVSTAPQLTSQTPNLHVPSLGPGETASTSWQVEAMAPGDAHYRVMALQSGHVLAQQDLETRIPELVVGSVTNPPNPGLIHLEADGRFCPDAGIPCVNAFPGNVGGVPIPNPFEWQRILPVAFVPGPTGATPALLTDHGARSFVYTAVDVEDPATGALNLYLAYDFLTRLLPFQPFQPADRPTVLFDVAGGRFAGRMVVTFLCGQGGVLVSGFDTGVPFFDRPGDQLGITGACGNGKSPNPTGDPFFDMFTDTDLRTRGFNVPHAVIELEVPLTQTLGGDPNPGGGVYDPAPAFWSASAPDAAGDPILSQNMVAIDIMTGSSTVTPLEMTPPTTTSSTTTTTTTTATTASSTSTTTTTTIVPGNAPPDCRAAVADPAELWPPNHRFVGVSVVGVTDPDGEPVTITIAGVTQDEPPGTTCPDGTGVGTTSASLRAERLGSGDGRVYQVSFTADDGRGGRCSGTVTVCVPHDQRAGHICGDQGPLFDSSVCP